MSVVREARPIEPAHLGYVLANLSRQDATDMFALRWDCDMALLHQQMCQLCSPLWRLWLVDDAPAAVFCATPLRPGVVLIGTFGTPSWSRALPSLVRYFKREFLVSMHQLRVHRLEAYFLAKNAGTVRLAEGVGGELEARLYEYGREREDFLLYRWRVEDVLRRQQFIGDEVSVLHQQQRPNGRWRAGPAAGGH